MKRLSFTSRQTSRPSTTFWMGWACRMRSILVPALILGWYVKHDINVTMESVEGKNTKLIREVSRSLQTRRVPNNHDKCLSIDKNSRLSSWWYYRTVIPSANTSECVALLPDINVPFICARENGTGKQFVSESVTYLQISQLHMLSVNTWEYSCMSAYCFTFFIRRACGLHIEIWRLKCIVWYGDKNVCLSESLVGST